MSYLTQYFLMAPPGGEGAIINLLFLAALFFVFYFFIIRPQSKRQKEIQQKVSAMKKGDKAVTSGGVIGQVNSVDEQTVLLDVDSGVKIRFQKSAITDVNPDQPVKE